MSGSLVLLNLAGAVALLLWATRMVRTGVERGYGDVLKRHLRATMDNPLMATATGLALAIALQSSTAVTLLIGSFAGSGILTGLAGILAVRGAEVGSALVVRILSYDLSLLVPLCLVAGTAIFLTTERRDWRQIGRITVGIGLMILSLQMMGAATEPLRHSEILPVIVGYLAGDPITAFLLAALVTWLFHSSIAAVLLLAALAAEGILGTQLGVVMVLGVNLGSSVIAPVLTRNARPETRVVPLANLLMRGAGSVIAMTGFTLFDPPMGFVGASVSEQIINAHILFNVIVLVVGVPLSTLVLRATKGIIALTAPAADETPIAETQVSALDPSALETPHLALANATRETMRVCETVELMLTRIIDLYEEADKRSIGELAGLDDGVDRRHAAIKHYLARIAGRNMGEDDAMRCQELLDACIKLEQVGDIIVRNLLVHVKRKLDRKVSFTPEGWRELTAFHASVLANARLAFNVLISRDRETALQLVREKDRLRDRERETSSLHFERLREGTSQSIETSTIHLDTIRDLKQINSLLATLAYPVLEENGLLRESRLNAGAAEDDPLQ